MATLLRECSSLPSDETTHILLTRPHSDRASRLKSLTNMQHEFDACLSRVLALQEDLSTVARLLTSHRSKLARASVSIPVLPSEILLMIFGLACSPDAIHNHPLMPIQLSHVSARWRALVLSVPEMWTTVPVRDVLAAPASEMIQEYARRAADRPLTLRFMDNTPAALGTSAIEPLYFSGVETLKFEAQSAADVCETLRSIQTFEITTLWLSDLRLPLSSTGTVLDARNLLHLRVKGDITSILRAGELFRNPAPDNLETLDLHVDSMLEGVFSRWFRTMV